MGATTQKVIVAGWGQRQIWQRGGIEGVFFAEDPLTLQKASLISLSLPAEGTENHNISVHD